MANFKNGIQLSVKLDTKDQAESELNKLISELNKNKIDLNINTNNLKKNLQEAFNLDGITKSAYSSAKVFEKEMDNLADSMAKVREESNKKSNNDYLKSELSQAKAINKALEDNYKSTLKEAEAQKQVQNEIQKQIKLLEIRKQGMTAKDSKVDTSDIDNAISKYKQLDNISMKDLRNEISYINAELKASSSSAETFGSKLSGMLGRVGIYVNAGDIFRSIINGVKDAIDYTISVENSMIDLRRIVDLSDESAKSFQSSMHDVSISLASTNDQTIETVANFAKLGYSLNEAQTLANTTTKYNFASDINDMNSATSTMISTLKAFKLEAKDAMTVGDDINQVSNNFAVSANDINDGLAKSSATLASFGNSLNESISMITTGTEIIQDGNVVGNAIKTASARITTNKNALKWLDSFNISIEDSNGNLKSTYQILTELAPKLNELKGEQSAQAMSDLFGKQNISSMLAIINNIDQMTEVMNSLENATGSVDSEFNRYLDSTQAKLSQLKENLGGLYSQFVNSDMTKGTVDGLNVLVTSLTTVISKLGAIPITIATVVGSLTIFNSKFREMSTAYQPTKITEFIGKLNGLSGVYKSQIVTINENITAQKTQIATQNQTGLAFVTSRAKLLGYQTQLGIATVAENACAIGAKALGVAFNMALGVGVGFVIQGLMEFANASETAKQKNEELLSTIQQTKTDMSTMSELEAQFKSINEALQSGTLTDNEALQKKKDLKGVYDQLIQACPQLEGALSLENGKYADNIKLLEQAIKLKQDQLKLDTEKYLTDNDVNDKGIQKQIDKIKELQESIQSFSGKSLMTNDELIDSGNMTIFGKMFGSGDDKRKYFEQLKNDSKQELIDLQNDLQNELAKINSAENLGIKIGVSEESKNNISQSIEVISQILNNGTQSLDNNTNSIKLNSEGISLLKQAQEELNSVGVVSKDTLDKLNQVCPELGINAQNASEILGDMSGAISEAGDSADKASTSLENLSKAFNDLSNTNSDIDSVIADMQEFGGITEQTYSKIIDNPAILQALTSEGDTIQNLTKLQEENRQSMEDRIQQAVDTANGVNSSQQSEADSKVDTDNQKQQSDSNTNNQIRQNTSDTTTQNSENYGKDGSNFDSTSQAKNSSDSGFQSAWRGNTADSVNEMGGMYQTDYSNFKSATDAKNALLENFRSNLASMGSVFSNAEDALNPLVNTLTQPWNVANGSSEGIAGALDNAFGTDSLKAMQEYKDGLSQIAGTFDSITGKKITTGNVQAPEIKKVSSSAPSMVKGNSGESGSKGGSGGSGSSGESDAEKWTDKIKELNSSIDIDRYADLNSQLDILDNHFTDNKNSLDGLTEGTKAYHDKQKEQIDIMKEQASTYSLLAGSYATERDELKQNLSQYGILTDATGKLTNAEAKLKYQQDLANDMSGNTEEEYKAKKKQINAIKELEENIKRYREVTESEIPKCTQKWDELNNTIIKTQREQLQAMMDDLASALETKYSKAKEEELQKVEDWYSQRKENLESEYQQDLASLQDEKQSIVDEYDEQIKKLQAQLDKLNDESDNKQAKLSALKAELALWGKDTSVFSKRKQEELNQSIKDLELEIQKDNLQKEIDALKDKQSAQEDSLSTEIDNLESAHDDELDELEKSYNAKKKETEDHYDKLLDEQSRYNEASKLMMSNSQEEILELLQSKSEDWKNVGILLGENFADGLRSQVEQVMSDLSSLTGGTLGKNNSTSNNNSYTSKENNMATSSGNNNSKSNSINGKSYTVDDSGNISSKDALSNEEIAEIQKKIARFATGGRTPSNMSGGKLGILDPNEKILNSEDTNTFDKGMEIINTDLKDFIDKFDSTYKLNTLNGYSNLDVFGNTTDLNSMANRAMNNTTNNSSDNSTIVQMDVNIVNNNLQDVGMNEKNIEKVIRKVVKTDGRRFK